MMKKILLFALFIIFNSIFLFSLHTIVNAQEGKIQFIPYFRASWPHIDRPDLYDYAATGFINENNKWNVWYCGEDIDTNPPGDSIFYTGLTDGQYDPIPTRVLANTQNDIFEDGRHTCAPTVVKHSNPNIENGKELYKMYYECARRFYDKENGGIIEGFTQICHAVSGDGMHWRKFNQDLWDSQFRYGDASTSPTAVVKAPNAILNNCQYEFSNNQHKIVSSCSPQVNINNYGVGHPTAIVMDINGSQQIWLYYFDSRGSWPPKVYLAKSWDGFHFETPIETNLTQNVDVKYFAIPVGSYSGYFIATQGIDNTNYFAYSFDGINWTWYGNTNNKEELKIGLAVDDGTHQAAFAQPAVLSNKYGIVTDPFVNILSGEGVKGRPWYETAGLWLIQGSFVYVPFFIPSPTPIPIPSSTPIPPTNTPIPTSTPVPSSTPVPPTSTPIPPSPTPIPTLNPCPAYSSVANYSCTTSSLCTQYSGTCQGNYSCSVGEGFHWDCCCFTPTQPTSTPNPPTITPTPIPGDITELSGTPDGVVNIYDYNLLIGDFGKSGSLADIDGNGIVDIYDYNILITNFGRHN